MGFTKKQCRDQKKKHLAQKLNYKKKVKRNPKEDQSPAPEMVNE